MIYFQKTIINHINASTKRIIYIIWAIQFYLIYWIGDRKRIPDLWIIWSTDFKIFRFFYFFPGCFPDLFIIISFRTFYTFFLFSVNFNFCNYFFSWNIFYSLFLVLYLSLHFISFFIYLSYFSYFFSRFSCFFLFSPGASFPVPLDPNYSFRSLMSCT